MPLPFETKPRALIFDLDGVILDSMPAHVAAWRSAFAEVGLKVAAEFIFRHEGALDKDLVCTLLARDGKPLSPAVFEQVRDRQQEIYLRRHRARVRVYPEAARLIEGLARGPAALALVTSSVREVLGPELWAWLGRCFALILTGDQVRRPKPHPEPYQKALAGLGLAAEAALVVENAPAGIEAAQRAGLRCLALATTLAPGELAGADLVLADHQALTSLLQEQGLLGGPALGPGTASTTA